MFEYHNTPLAGIYKQKIRIVSLNMEFIKLIDI